MYEELCSKVEEELDTGSVVEPRRWDVVYIPLPVVTIIHLGIELGKTVWQ